jgi:hypothetical protein
MKPTDAQLRSWKTSGAQYKILAAIIAEWAADQESGTVLPGSYVFTRDLSFEPSPATIQHAKGHLAAHGVLAVSGRYYHVA